MDKLGKKMSRKKFLLILIPLMVLLVGLVIAITAVMNAYEPVMNNMFGRPPVYVTPMENTETWDADYYGKKNGSQEKADAAAEELAVRSMEEGAVLLKNRNKALPLAADQTSPLTVNAFGWSFYYPVNGGAGAGAIGSDNLVSPEDALAGVGIRINQTLKTAYTDWTAANCSQWGARTPARPTVSLGAALAHWDVPELDDPGSVYDSSNAAENTTSIVWLGRSGGEGADAPRQMDKAHGAVSFDQNPDKHYLELTNNEEKLIATVSEKSEKVIVILNSPSPMEIGALEDNDNIDAILWIGAPGKKGYHGVANVISGAANPSGRLPDTYASDFLDNPTIVNFSDPNIYASNKTEDIITRYDGHIDYQSGSETKNRQIYYLGYEEGIYNGYRWYESAAAEGYFAGKTAPAGTTDTYYNRDNGVVYPFGYGMSYTTFTQKIVSKSYSDGVFTIDVEVKNTGDVAGKDVVQLYAETPYVSGGVEKSKVVLAAFDKTSTLQKSGANGDTETVRLTVNAEDIASYDDTTEKAYVLDEGTYTFYLGTVDGVNYGSHGWAYADEDSKAEFETAIAKKIVYSDGKDGKRESDSVTATNRFDEDMKYNNLKVADGSKTMSRKNFAATYPTAPTAEDKVLGDGLKAALEDNLYDTKANVQKHNNPDDEMPLVGQDNGINLNSLRGKSYDDPAWEKFVEQFTVEEMRILACRSGWQTEAVTRLGKPLTAENDGPQCLKTASLGTDIGAQYLVAFPCEIVLAATWNQDLLYEIGEAIGEEGLQYGMNGWYAPATNIHRTPFSGRNFEYFSEDPVLAGKLCAREVSGAASKGLYAFVKHFAVNDQESYARNLNAGASLEFSINGSSYELKGNDCILLTWASEQTLREIYLKAFEIVFKEAKTDLKYLDDNGEVQVIKDFRAATAVMTSFNCIGDTWAGGSYALITEILRGEWGFQGFVLTDSVRTDFMYADQMMRAGGDACLMSTEIPIYDLESATAIKCLQSTAKNICYTVVHSNAMNDVPPGAKISYGLAPWAIVLLIANIIVGLLVIGGVVWIVLRVLDEKKHPDKYKK